jgi:hypothetical protein
MFTRLIKRVSNLSPGAVIVGILIAALAATGVGLFLMRGGPNVAEAALEPSAARIDRVDGNVAIAHIAEEEDEELDWVDAAVNTPVTVGDRVYVRGDDGLASIALTGHNYVRLNPGTSLDLLSLEEERTQLALRTGSGLFDVGEIGSDDLYEVATPYGAVDFVEPGLYEINLQDGNALISVLSGLAQVVGQGGSGYISKGEVLTLIGEAAAQAVASRLEPGYAGGVVDNYYRYRHPTVYDGRYQNYDDYLEDPLYYDSYDNSVSSRYVNADLPGIYELDSYGDWSDLDGYGHCWAPRVDAGWAPFRDGSWDLHRRWGPTWISNEPWGWAPYHYGRWAFVNQRWFWVPGDVAVRRAYCPAPVAFIPLRQTSQIAWVPLAPGEVYVPRYYDADFQPRYLAAPHVVREITVQRTFVNFDAPSGVTVVPFRSLRRRIDPSMVVQVDRDLIANNSPAIDPFAIDSVRRIASNRERRSRIKLARAEQEALNRPVVASVTPASFETRGNGARAFRVEQVSETRRKNELKIDKTAQFATGRRRDGVPNLSQQPSLAANGNDREQMRAALQARAEQGDKSARVGLRQLRREEKRVVREQRTTDNVSPQVEAMRQRVQQDQLQRQMKRQARQQQNVEGQPRQQQKVESQPRQQQTIDQAQRKAARKARQNDPGNQQKQQRKPPQAFLQQQQQLEQMRNQQLKQAKRQARIQQNQKAASLPAQSSQQLPQVKAQRRFERQQRAMIEQRNKIPAMRVDQGGGQSQMREQIRAQKRVERQQRAVIDPQNKIPVMRVDQAARQAQAREQLKAQRRMEQQQRSASVTVQQRVPVQASPNPALSSKEAVQSTRRAEKMQRKGKGN